LIRRSPYHDRFTTLGAQFIDRLGFAAPAMFSSVEEEHLATRTAVGLYDVYYQVGVEVAGSDAEAVLQDALVTDVARLPISRVVYTSLCNDSGGMIDDLTCFRMAPDRFCLYPTPSRVEAVIQAVSDQIKGRHSIVTNLGYKRAYLSVQGPRSRELLQGLTEVNLSGAALPYFSFTEGTLAGVPGTIISRTGYSGELGYELFYPSEYAHHLFDTVMEAGRPLDARPCGLGALRSVRMEKKYPLYGLDVDETTTPIEAGLSWTVKFDKKAAFRGREILQKQKLEGPSRQLVLLALEEETLPTRGDQIVVESEKVGMITSAERGHFVRRPLALGYVESRIVQNVQTVSIAISSGRSVTATLMTQAVYDPSGKRVRS
jgi:aminomethyltransferase